jgi:Spy/CpxP family protein refolding chaperone
MTADGRLRVWFALFVLTIFCGGLGAGIFMGQRMTRPTAAASEAAGPRPGFFFPMPFARNGGRGHAFMLDRLTETLSLTPEQRGQLEEILKRSRTRAAAAQQDVRARFETEQRTLREEIRAILTPAQRTRFEEWSEQGPGGRGFGRGPTVPE